MPDEPLDPAVEWTYQSLLYSNTMKKRVLLIDESLTVQKVVALTLDRNRYTVHYAKSRSEAMKDVLQTPPDLILASDQVNDINVSSFPKEVESWVGRERRMPPIILITGQDVKEARHYKGVLRKPFSPQALQAVVVEHTRGAEEGAGTSPGTSPGTAAGQEDDDNRLQKIFNDTFADEAKLTRETFDNEAEDDERTLLTIPAPPPRPAARPAPAPPPKKPEAKADDDVWNDDAPPQAAAPPKAKTTRSVPPPPPETAAELWGHQKGAPAAEKAAPEPANEILGAEDSVAYKAVLEKQVESHLRDHDLDEVVDRLLKKMLPPIVEKLVQERLDRLMKEQESYVELKP